MVKHNNVVPNIHCKKKYLQSSRGPLKVRLALNKSSKKVSRRLARAARAAAIAPRPLQLLRPSVYCPTQRYSGKARLGRGFTLEEIKAAGLTATYARTVGIAVDSRRTNRSEESLARNTARLEEYKSKLILFPKKRLSKKNPTLKAGDATKEQRAAATQLTGTVMPLVAPVEGVVMGDVTDSKAYTQMRVARQENAIVGHRASVANRKEK